MNHRCELSKCYIFKGKNTIVIVSGANLLLNETSISRAESVIKSAKVLICQLEISPKVTLEALKLAKKHGGKSPIWSNLVWIAAKTANMYHAI